MHSNKHTPGPWKVAEAEFIEGQDDCFKFHIQMPPGKGCISKANCNVIAAAPDMLEALVDLDEACWDFEDHANAWEMRVALKKARAAIAKAKGEA